MEAIIVDRLSFHFMGEKCFLGYYLGTTIATYFVLNAGRVREIPTILVAHQSVLYLCPCFNSEYHMMYSFLKSFVPVCIGVHVFLDVFALVLG